MLNRAAVHMVRAMIPRLSLALILVGLPSAVTAQAASRDTSIRTVRALEGAASFEVPASWRALRAGEGDMAFVYRVPNPAGDSIPGVTTNVLVNVEARGGKRQFTAYCDTVLGQWMSRKMIVLGDTTIGHERALFWRGESQDSTIYVGYDDIAQVDSIWVHVRIVMPLVGSDESWSRQFSRETGALLQSVLVNRRRAFPASIGYPVLTTFAPGG